MIPVTVLHEFGAPAHFRALERLLGDRGAPPPRYREFSSRHAWKRLLRHGDWRPLARWPRNLLSMIRLAVTGGEVVVLGMAPFDPRMPMVRRILRELAPHPPFPPSLAASFDVIEMIAASVVSRESAHLNAACAKVASPSSKGRMSFSFAPRSTFIAITPMSFFFARAIAAGSAGCLATKSKARVKRS